MKKTLSLLLAFLLPLSLHAQTGTGKLSKYTSGASNNNLTPDSAFNFDSTAPVTVLSGGTLTFNSSATGLFSAGSTLNVTGATLVGFPFGTGSVTTFSSGSLSPLFTTTVATATTTPALSFTLSNAAAGTVFGNPTGSSAAPGYNTLSAFGLPTLAGNNVFTGANTFQVAAQGLTAPITPSSMTWNWVNSQTIKAPIAAGLITSTFDFSRGQFSPPLANANITVSNGTWTTAGGAGLQGLQCNDIFTIPFFSSVMSVMRMAGNGSGDQIFVGVANKTNTVERFGFIYDNVTHTITGLLNNNGPNIFFGATGGVISGVGASGAYSVNLGNAPFQIAFSFASCGASCWIRTQSGWTQVAVFDASVYYDLRTPSVLSNWNPFFYSYNTAGSNPIVIAAVQSGYLGGTTAANMSQVCYEDGTPIIKDNKQFFLCNIVGVSPTSAQDVSTATQTIFSIDQDSFHIQQVSEINTLRSGALYGENSGCYRFNRTLSPPQWQCMVPNWGDGYAGTIRVYLYTTSEDLLHGVHVLTGGTLINLPLYDSGTQYIYDPDFVEWAGTYYVAYSENDEGPIYPALASGTSLSSLSLVARNTSATTSTQGEGTKIRTIGGTNYVLAGSRSNNGTMNLYNFSTMALVTSWPTVSGLGGGPAAHPNVMYVERGGVTSYFMPSVYNLSEPAIYNPGYNQGNSQGDFSIVKCNQTSTGYELPVIESVYP